MMVRILALLLAALVLATLMLAGAPAAFADARSAAGQITDVEGRPGPGEAVVDRAAGGRRPAQRFTFLEPGDKVSVRRVGVAVVVYLRGDKARRVTQASGPLQVPRVAATRPPSGPGALLQSIAYLFNANHRPIPVDTQVRGMALAASPLLPEGEQLLPVGVKHASVIWSGGVEEVAVKSRGLEILGTAGGHAYESMEISPDQPFRVEVRGGALAWPVSRVGAGDAPCPDWCPTGGPVAEADRLERALWLLSLPDTRWRMFALGEIADLAPSYYAAARVRHAIRSGELTQLGR